MEKVSLKLLVFVPAPALDDILNLERLQTSETIIQRNCPTTQQPVKQLQPYEFHKDD